MRGYVAQSGTLTVGGTTDTSQTIAATLGAKANIGQQQRTDEEWRAITMDLLYDVDEKVRSVSNLPELVEDIVRMAQHTLKASASSMLLIDEIKQDLFFQVAEGKTAKAVTQVRLSARTGVAGWVADHGQPAIVNDVRNDPRFNREIDEITGFVTKSIACVPLIVRRKTIGVLEVLNKLDRTDFTAQDLETLLPVASTAAMAIENTRLHQSVLDGYRATIRALAAAIDAKDPYTCGHSERVTQYALLGGVWLSLPKEELEVLEYAATLHDIGKIGIADDILLKPGPLALAEWQIISRHPLIGVNIIKHVPFLEKARELILYHHERYDGTGYPEGLRSEEIPLGARLLAVADAYDTMTTDRSYRAALSTERALDELQRCTGTQFCPVAANAFISGLNEQSGAPNATHS